MNTRNKNKKRQSCSNTVGPNKKTPRVKGTTASLGEIASPNTQIPLPCIIVGIQRSENNFMVTLININKVIHLNQVPMMLVI